MHFLKEAPNMPYLQEMGISKYQVRQPGTMASSQANEKHGQTASNVRCMSPAENSYLQLLCFGTCKAKPNCQHLAVVQEVQKWHRDRHRPKLEQWHLKTNKQEPNTNNKHINKESNERKRQTKHTHTQEQQIGQSQDQHVGRNVRT